MLKDATLPLHAGEDNSVQTQLAQKMPAHVKSCRSSDETKLAQGKRHRRWRLNGRRAELQWKKL